MATKLVFSRAPITGMPVSLVFGDDVDSPQDTLAEVRLTSTLPGLTANVLVGTIAYINVSSQLPGLSAQIRVENIALITVASSLPGLSAVASSTYVSGANRPGTGNTGSMWQSAIKAQAGATATVNRGVATAAGRQNHWQRGAARHKNHHLLLPDLFVHQQLGYAVVYQEATAAGHQVTVQHEDALRTARGAWQVVFEGAVQSVMPPITTAWQERIRLYRPRVDVPWGEAVRCHFAGSWTLAAKAQMLQSGIEVVYQNAWRPRPGNHPPPVVPPVLPSWGADLIFQCPPLTFPALVFGAQQCYLPGASLYILPARFYMSIHSIWAQRFPDLTDIPIYDATVSADSGSYCWTLSASGPASLFNLLAPVGGLPVQLRVWLDGIPWVFAIDSLSRSSRFGSTGVSISGRSVTALIGAPYLRSMTRDNMGGDQTAQQLALSALEYSGVGLDWGLTDWLVPAGAWSHNGTPLDALQTIAAAAGGYLQSHRSEPTLLTRHPYSQRTGDYPGAPWGWMTGPADIELAPDAIITDGTERRDGADINAVYVSGTTSGVLGFVKRTGSAGDKLAAMVSDALITHTDAARQRGLSVLGAAGSKYNVRLQLPVLTGANQPGVFDVGQLVQINATVPWRGRVKAVSVSAKSPSLRQTITLERHLETAS